MVLIAAVFLSTSLTDDTEVTSAAEDFIPQEPLRVYFLFIFIISIFLEKLLIILSVPIFFVLNFHAWIAFQNQRAINKISKWISWEAFCVFLLSIYFLSSCVFYPLVI